MKKILVFIIGILILFAGCTSQPNTNTNNTNDQNNTTNGTSNKTLYEQIEEEAICPCSALFNLKDCKKYFPDCQYTPIVDATINNMISEGKTKDQILQAVDQYNTGIIEGKLNEFRESQEENRVIVLYFKSSVCEICHEKEPVLDEIKEKYKGKIDIYEFDRVEDGVIFDYFIVDRIPSIIFFDGKSRLNDVPFNNITVDGISSLLDFTLDKKK
ncbi:MAG: thioredoxin family protein [Candidatus Methanofastidiosum sp.]|nr:thioredoxin family protein [Methanofastidiosum sp.]NYT13926.1 thioredoxin family protein [Candidatus Methanofastidiosa archaeon]